MAMVKCPECGKEISTLSQTCVHCGCKITVCKKCNQVTAGEAGKCAHCGEPFSVATPKPENALLTQNETKLERKLHNLKIGSYICGAIGVVIRVVFLICFAIGIFGASKTLSISTISLTENVIKSMFRAFGIIGIILAFADGIVKIVLEYFKSIGLAKWLEQEKIDGKTFLIKKKSFIEKPSTEIVYLKNASYLIDNPKEKGVVISNFILRSFGDILINIAVSFMLIVASHKFHILGNEALSIKPILSLMFNAWNITIFILGLVLYIVSSVFSTSLDKKVETWGKSVSDKVRLSNQEAKLQHEAKASESGKEMVATSSESGIEKRTP